MLFQTSNPFSASPSVASSAQRGTRERFRNAVFLVLAAHVVLVMGLLMGCNTEPSARTLADTYPTVDQSPKASETVAMAATTPGTQAR